MIPAKGTLKYAALRFALLLGGLGWSISFAFTFSSWQTSTDLLYGMGAKPIEYQALLDYWLKMASALFGCIGLLFLACFTKMHKYAVIIPLLAYGSIFIGSILLFSAYQNSLDPQLHPSHIIDILFCYIVGILILYATKKTST
jgi:predicted neutral ceramidase superfamily lipid hydrolase